MFERVITQTIQSVAADVVRERSQVGLTEILESERIPERFKPFFATEVRWWLHGEALSRAANKRFDWDHPELSALLGYLDDVQFRHARFERDEFMTVLDSAVKLTYNYLCRPQVTLKWYIFRGQPVKPLREVMLRLDAFVDYPYFRSVFSDWVERKRQERPTFDAISATEFERIVRRIDDQILISCTVEDLLTMMDPLFDVVGEGDEKCLPLDALVIFFDDKHIKRLVDHLEEIRDHRSATVGRDDFVGLLEELLTTSDENPEADFSTVYQNDELDDVVRRHLETEGRAVPISDAEVADLTAAAAAAPPPIADAPEPATGFVDSTGDVIERGGEALRPTAATVSEESASDHTPSADHERSADQATDEHAAVEDDAADDEAAEGNRSDTTEREVAEAYDLDQYQADIEAAVGDEVEDEEVRDEETEDELVEEAEDVEFGEGEVEIEEVGEEEFSDEEVEDAEVGDEEVRDEEESDRQSADAEGDVEELSEVAIEDRPGEDETERQVNEAATDDADTADGTEFGVDDGVGAPGAEQPLEEVGDRDPETTVAEDEAEPAATESMSGESARRDTSSLSTNGAAGDGHREADDLPEPPEASPGPMSWSSGATTTPKMKDVRLFIDAVLERKIIRKIFGRNREEYEAAISRINDAETWRDASQILVELYLHYDIDPESRTASRFSDSVYGRYRYMSESE